MFYKELKTDPIYYTKKSLKIPKEQSETVYRRRADNTMAKRKGTKGQTTTYKPYIYKQEDFTSNKAKNGLHIKVLEVCKG